MQVRASGGRITLKDGREVVVRPILPSDGELLVDMFRRISPRTIYQRFLRNLEELPEDLLHHFTHPGCESDVALAAVTEEGGREVVVAVGRYARDPHEDVNDIALAVRDDWQNLGLGKSLLQMVVAAGVKYGIKRFGSMMDPGNTVMDRILRDLGYDVRYSLRNGSYVVDIAV